MIKVNGNKIRTLLVGAGLLLSSTAFAQMVEGYPSNYDFLLSQKPMDVMHMMDKGKKGFVTKEEYMKFHEEMWTRMDKNKDGKLSAEEWLGRQLRSSDGSAG